MVLGSVHGDAEVGRYLLVRQPLAQQRQDFPLTRCEDIGMSGPAHPAHRIQNCDSFVSYLHYPTRTTLQRSQRRVRYNIAL